MDDVEPLMVNASLVVGSKNDQKQFQTVFYSATRHSKDCDVVATLQRDQSYNKKIYEKMKIKKVI